MDEKTLQMKIQSKVRTSLPPLLAKYNMDLSDLDASLKWKPIVLILGNYSSGKSTFINELVGEDIQRTGQAPTDDSFTILTSPFSDQNDNREVTGADLVNDEGLPFVGFKEYGERFISHFRLKPVSSPIFENLALIDSPGMLDSISEKDRGYDYARAVKDFARMADLIILMFDPHKAGTIQETYNAIRNTLPEATGEDRIIFVMSRIDECDNIADLVRSYGTLCWNLSQMTGRKDIPRIYLTFSPLLSEKTSELTIWEGERELLKKKVMAAPGVRISHILQDVDKRLQEVQIVAEAMQGFSEGGKKIIYGNLKKALVLGGFFFFFLDVIIKEIINIPETTLFTSLMKGGDFVAQQLLIPVVSFVVIFILAGGWLLKWQLPRYYRRCLGNIDNLIILDTEYRKNLWERVRQHVMELLAKPKISDLYQSHAKNIAKVERFMKGYVQKYYEMIRK